MTPLIGFAASRLGPKWGKFAKPFVFGARAILIGLALWGGKCAYDKSVIDKHEQKIERRAKPATDQAAAERGRDTISNAKNDQERHDVIEAQPDQPIAPTSRALSCKRLRDAGRHTAACG